MALCLVIEDDADQRSLLAAMLRADGHDAVEASNAEMGRRLCSDHLPEVVVLDLGLPDGDGLALIPELHARSPLSRIIVLTGRNTVAGAVAALRAGARHYLLKPWDDEELLLVVEREIRTVEVAEARERLVETDVFRGSHPTLTRLHDQLERLAPSPHTPVLIQGETGSGKEVVARELHRLSQAGGAFIAMNCASIPSELMESELFGHEKGAFTGAEARRKGLAELARDGTLFLDEIGEMALPLQAKLLRFLQDHRFRRVGGEKEIQSKCRIMAATHRNLEVMEQDGSFRSDLYYRLAVVCLTIPPLRERREDILPLTYWLLDKVARAVGRPQKQLSPGAEQAIVEHHWRGNVRELRNRLERALVLGEEHQIQPEDLDLLVSAPASADGRLSETRDEAVLLRRLLEEEGWSISAAARRRGVPRHWLRYRMAKYDLRRPG